MKKFIKILGLAMTVIVLTGCTKLSFTSDSSNSDTSSKTGGYETTGTAADGAYQSIVKNGQYQVSKSRGLMLTQNNQNGNTFNVRSMEDGLVTLSQKEFPTTKYVFSEGQLLTTAVVKKWLSRESKTNKVGLNPAKVKQNTDEKTRAPLYLQQLLEQDYMVKNGSSYSIGGVSIGLGMNSVDYWTKVDYGATYETKIDTPTLTAKGKAMAQKVVARIRQKSGVSNTTPILIGIYRQTAQDSLVGGTYLTYMVSTKGTQLGAWKAQNTQNEVLPVIEGSTAINSTVASDFSSFSTQIRSFFPTLAGVTAQVHYEEGQLNGMKITINTQFYGQTEIESFTQYLQTAASKYLPGGVQIEISVKSTTGMQAFLARNTGEKTFYTHVFDSY